MWRWIYGIHFISFLHGRLYAYSVQHKRTQKYEQTNKDIYAHFGALITKTTNFKLYNKA